MTIGTDAVESSVKQNWQEGVTMDAADRHEWKDGDTAYRVYVPYGKHGAELITGRVVKTGDALVILYTDPSDWHRIDPIEDNDRWSPTKEQAVAEYRVPIVRDFNWTMRQIDALLNPTA